MPKNKKQAYLKDYVYSKKIKTNKRTSLKSAKFFVLLSVLLSFFIIVFFANIFSSLITPGTINLNRGERYFLGQKLYCVELANFDNIAKATEARNEYKQQLAAGYVVNDNGTFRVLAAAYKTRTNAESVVENLKQSEVAANIFLVDVPTLYLDLELENEQKLALKDCLNLFYNAYLKIYDLSMKLDKSEITLDQAKLELLALKTESEQVINNFNSKIEVPKTSEIIYTKIYMNTYLDRLNEIIAASQASSTYSADVKETYFKLIFDYISLKTELAKN
jgi:hypothetical protein